MQSSMSRKKRPPPTPDFVLRSHTADVTALCFCKVVPTVTKEEGVEEEATVRTTTTTTTTTSTTTGMSTTTPQHQLSLLVSGSTDGRVKFWDIESRRVILELNEHGGKGVLNIEWVDQVLLTQGRDGLIKTWNLRCDDVTGRTGVTLSAECVATLDNGSYTFAKISCAPPISPLDSFSHHSSLLAAPARSDTFFELWDLNQHRALIGHCVGRSDREREGGRTGMVMCLRLVWSTSSMKGGGSREVVSAVVGVESGEIGMFFDVLSPLKPDVESVVIVQDKERERRRSDESENKAAVGLLGSLLSKGSAAKVEGEEEEEEEGKMTTGGEGKGEEKGEEKLKEEPNNDSTCSSETRYENALAATVLGFTGDDASWMSLHTEPVLCLDVGSDPTDATQWFGVSGSADTTIGVFRINAADGSCVSHEKIEIPENGIADVKIRRDSKIFATAGWDGCVRVFSVKKLRPLAVLRYHEMSVHTIEFGAVEDGAMCTASKDGKIAWWSIYGSKENLNR